MSEPSHLPTATEVLARRERLHELAGYAATALRITRAAAVQRITALAYALADQTDASLELAEAATFSAGPELLTALIAQYPLEQAALLTPLVHALQPAEEEVALQPAEGEVAPPAAETEVLPE